MNIDFNTMNITTETIHPQINDPAITGMLDIVARLREDYLANSFSKSLVKYRDEMSRLISKRFGFNIKVLYISEDSYDTIYTYPILLKPISGISTWCYGSLESFEKDISKYNDKAIDSTLKAAENKVSIDYDDTLWVSLSKSFNSFKDYKRMLEIDIDTKKAYVHNFPKELTGYICVNIGVLIKDFELTDKEIVAIIWHEVGHSFTMIENTYKNIYNTNILVETIRDEVFKRNKTKEEAIKIAYKRITDKDATNMSALEVAAKLMEEQAAGWPMSFSDLSITDSELLADTFAVRFGLGGELASGLTKFPDYAQILATQRQIYPVVGIIIGILFSMLVSVLFGIGMFMMFSAFTMLVAGINWRQPIHDYSFDRIRRMKIDIIRQIKNHDLNIETKKDLITIIDNIDNISKKIKEPSENMRSVLDRMLNSTSRLAFNQKRAEKLYESLLDNELYTGSTRLEIITKG